VAYFDVEKVNQGHKNLGVAKWVSPARVGLTR